MPISTKITAVPQKLRLLADWLDLEQIKRPQWKSNEVQADLRQLANDIENPPTPDEVVFLRQTIRDLERHLKALADANGHG